MVLNSVLNYVVRLFVNVFFQVVENGLIDFAHGYLMLKNKDFEVYIIFLVNLYCLQNSFLNLNLFTFDKEIFLN